MAVIDVHTHMLTRQYLEFLDEHGGPKYECKPTKAGQESIFMYGAPFMTLMSEMPAIFLSLVNRETPTAP